MLAMGISSLCFVDVCAFIVFQLYPLGLEGVRNYSVGPVEASDLVGCRYRLVQRERYPDVPSTHASLARAERADAARAAVHSLLSSSSKNFRRVDLGGDDFAREMATLEAMAAGVHLITNARFRYGGWYVELDGLVRDGEAYLPIIVSNHRVAKKNPHATLPGVPTHRLGLSAPLDLPYKLRHHPVDGYRLALGAWGLQESDLDSGRGVVIGQDRETAFVVETGDYFEATERALATLEDLPDSPRRVKECASCRFWEFCRPELERMDDISLFLPGDRGRKYRKRGIHTVHGLIEANLGEPSRLAEAWECGIPLLKRPTFAPPRRADVEVDIDMEAYLDQGAYLWGVWHDGAYHPFVTWQPLGGASEGENFHEFWTWLTELRSATHARGETFAAYCYSAHGENHWLRSSAERFGIAQNEIEEFITSEDWVDLFLDVKRSFAGPHGLSLKTVAPVAGHAWAEDDFDGEASVNARRAAVAGDESARARLLEYNCGDVQATYRIREWMSAGAPGIGDL